MESFNPDNTILIVDPDQVSRDLYKLLLKKYYQIFVASSPSEAIEILKTNDIKVVLADQLLSEIPVLEFFNQISTLYSRSERILIATTLDNQLISNAVQIGKVFNYILKPFETYNLKCLIDNAIEKHNLQKQNDILILSLKQGNKELEYLFNKLKGEEEKFREIFNSSQDPIVIIRKNGVIIEANSNAQKTFDFKMNDFGKINILALIHHEYYKKTYRFLTLLQLTEQPLFETRMLTTGDEWKSFEINGDSIRFQNDTALLLIMRDTTERRETEKKILQAVIQTEESERRKFAQELHDGIGPLLSTAKLYLQWLRKPDSKIDIESALNKIEETLEETIGSVREVSNNLSPNALVNLGLEAAIKSILDRIKVSDINCKLSVELDTRLHINLESTIYRILGECINNTLKHAQAQNLSIDITQTAKSIDVRYQDDGNGFDVEKTLAAARGNGLANMQNRVISLGGSFLINSEPNEGTVIICNFLL